MAKKATAKPATKADTTPATKADTTQTDTQPADPATITEDQITAKVKESLGGLTRKEALAVLKTQQAHDAAQQQA